MGCGSLLGLEDAYTVDPAGSSTAADASATRDAALVPDSGSSCALRCGDTCVSDCAGCDVGGFACATRGQCVGSCNSCGDTAPIACVACGGMRTGTCASADQACTGTCACPEGAKDCAEGETCVSGACQPCGVPGTDGETCSNGKRCNGNRARCN